MNNGVTKENLMRVLPAPLDADQGMHDLGETAAEHLSALWSKIDVLRIYSRIDDLPESLLDILARDFKVDWYDYNYSISAKRALIKDSFFVHKHLGTVAAVKRALCDVWPQSTVEEWFTYGGRPYFFRVLIEATHQRESIIVVDLDRVVEMYKSYRSHLEDNSVTIRISCGIIIRTNQGAQEYRPRRTGTYPRIATHGRITEDDVVVGTKHIGAAYTAPRTGDNRAGTYPVTATHGGISENDLSVRTDSDRMKYTPRSTGTFPHVATHGDVAATETEVNTCQNQQAYGTPKSGQKATGDHPFVTIRGDMGNNAMNVGVTAGGAAYKVRPCGTSKDSLI